MKEEQFLFQSYNWKSKIEELFPRVPPELVIENEKWDTRLENKAYNIFLERIYRNYKNHRNRYFGNKDCEFAWFYQIIKMANKRYKEENIFILWLWLCIDRPWREREFLLDWGPTKEGSFYKVMDILTDLETNFDLNFSKNNDDKGIKTFYRYKKNELVRSAIVGLFTMGYSTFINEMNLIREYKRFIELLKSGTLVTKREFQRKLRIRSERLRLLIKLAKEKEIITLVKLSKNSTGLFYKNL